MDLEKKLMSNDYNTLKNYLFEAYNFDFASGFEEAIELLPSTQRKKTFSKVFGRKL